MPTEDQKSGLQYFDEMFTTEVVENSHIPDYRKQIVQDFDEDYFQGMEYNANED